MTLPLAVMPIEIQPAQKCCPEKRNLIRDTLSADEDVTGQKSQSVSQFDTWIKLTFWSPLGTCVKTWEKEHLSLNNCDQLSGYFLEIHSQWGHSLSRSYMSCHSFPGNLLPLNHHCYNKHKRRGCDDVSWKKPFCLVLENYLPGISLK